MTLARGRSASHSPAAEGARHSHGALGPSEMRAEHQPRDFTCVGQRRGDRGHGGTRGHWGSARTLLIWLWKLVLFANGSQRAEEPQNLPNTTVRFFQLLSFSKQCAAETTQEASSRVPPHNSAPFTFKIACTGTTRRGHVPATLPRGPASPASDGHGELTGASLTTGRGCRFPAPAQHHHPSWPQHARSAKAGPVRETGSEPQRQARFPAHSEPSLSASVSSS